MKKYPCIESTLEFEIRDVLIRLWINETEIKEVYLAPVGIKEKLNRFLEENFRPTNKELTNFFVDNVPNLNAVQFKNIKKGEGFVVYTVDFSGDIHG